jgi:hypothetical protein
MNVLFSFFFVLSLKNSMLQRVGMTTKITQRHTIQAKGIIKA